jgi:hypothetical protein
MTHTMPAEQPLITAESLQITEQSKKRMNLSLGEGVIFIKYVNVKNSA